MNAPPSTPRLLLATEHTEHDSGAEAVALALARRRGVPLAVVLPLARSAELEMDAPAAAERADAEAAARREALAALAVAAGVTLDLHVRRGPELYAEIVQEAQERGSELLILRRRGKRSLLANLLVGEMVSRVLAHAPCSVLVAPRDAQLWQRTVLVGVDPQHAAPSLLAAAADMACECGAALHLVCVAANEAMQPVAGSALAAALALCAHPDATGEVRVGVAHAELMACAAARGADLLVVARQGGGAVTRARIGGVAQKVTGLATCPVLVHVPPTQPKP